jgi:hypothetical protein
MRIVQCYSSTAFDVTTSLKILSSIVGTHIKRFLNLPFLRRSQKCPLSGGSTGIESFGEGCFLEQSRDKPARGEFEVTDHSLEPSLRSITILMSADGPLPSWKWSARQGINAVIGRTTSHPESERGKENVDKVSQIFTEPWRSTWLLKLGLRTWNSWIRSNFVIHPRRENFQPHSLFIRAIRFRAELKSWK